jgi:hypothetical protein
MTANLTPRKCLGFKTPLQAILKEWQRRANPVCLALLHLAPESRDRSKLVDQSNPFADAMISATLAFAEPTASSPFPLAGRGKPRLPPSSPIRTRRCRIVDDAHEAQLRSPAHPGGIETTAGGHTARRAHALLPCRFAVCGADLLSGARCSQCCLLASSTLISVP